MFDSGTGVIAGFGINSRWLPHGAFSLGRRFGFASDPDISFVLFADKDAFLQGSQPMTGGGLSFEADPRLGQSSSRSVPGDHKTGSTAWGFSRHLGPDFLGRQQRGEGREKHAERRRNPAARRGERGPDRAGCSGS